MKRSLVVFGSLLGVLVLVLVVRTLRLESAQFDVEPLPEAAIDLDGAVARMQRGLRIRTIAHDEGVASEQLVAFRAFLAGSYPGVHQTLSLEHVSEHTLLFHWPGLRPELPAVLLLAHQDVVPVDPGTEGSWAHPPWDGVVADGHLWGRGAIDDKLGVFGILEAVEGLIAEGFVPTRTLYLAFGHDEEIGGDGAKAVAELLAERRVTLQVVLDEGGAVVEDALPGFDRPLGLVGIAEKGYLSVVLEVDDHGGHSSMPRSTGAIGILARAVARLEESQLPSRLSDSTRAFLERGVGPELAFPLRVLAANLWLFETPIASLASQSPSTAAMMRTTTAPTIFQSGVKDNVLPARARAVVNFRILTGETSDDVLAHVVAVIDDERVRIGTTQDRIEPSPASSVDHPGYALVSRSIREVFPEAVVVPYLVLGGTDARHFSGLCECVYRFAPIQTTTSDFARAHGTDERVSVANIASAVRFYRRFIENAQGGPGG